jgi:hypothetical protein
MIRRQLRLETYSNASGAVVAPLVAAGVFALCNDPLRNGGCLIAASTMLLIGLILAVRVALPWWWPRRHWLLRHLADYGPPHEVAARIDAEWNDPGGVLAFGQAASRWTLWVQLKDTHPFGLVSANWLLYASRTEVRLVSLERVDWVFLHAEAKWHWLKGEGQSYALGYGLGPGGKPVSLPMTDRDCAERVAAWLIRQRPELLVGFRGEYAEWAAADSERLRRERAGRRAQFDALPSDEQRDWVECGVADWDEWPLRIDPNLSESWE